MCSWLQQVKKYVQSLYFAFTITSTAGKHTPTEPDHFKGHSILAHVHTRTATTYMHAAPPTREYERNRAVHLSPCSSAPSVSEMVYRTHLVGSCAGLGNVHAHTQNERGLVTAVMLISIGMVRTLRIDSTVCVHVHVCMCMCWCVRACARVCALMCAGCANLGSKYAGS